MSMHKEDWLELKDIVVDYVRENPKKVAFVAAFAIAFALGVWARSAFAAYACTGSVPGTLTCIEAGSGGSPPEPVPVPPDVSACPAGTVFIRGQWGKDAIETAAFGPFGANTIVIEIKVPATATGTAVRTSAWVEYQSGPVVREAAFSTKPCDFTAAAAMKNYYGAPLISKDQIRFSFGYRIGQPGQYSTGLEAGKTYYINVRNRMPSGAVSCPIADCSMRGSVPN